MHTCTRIRRVFWGTTLQFPILGLRLRWARQFSSSTSSAIAFSGFFRRHSEAIGRAARSAWCLLERTGEGLKSVDREREPLKKTASSRSPTSSPTSPAHRHPKPDNARKATASLTPPRSARRNPPGGRGAQNTSPRPGATAVPKASGRPRAPAAAARVPAAACAARVDARPVTGPKSAGEIPETYPTRSHRRYDHPIPFTEPRVQNVRCGQWAGGLSGGAEVRRRVLNLNQHDRIGDPVTPVGPMSVYS